MLLQAHRGVCTEYPENTMAAFWGAIYQDYKIIELDPNVTADGQFVILHDNTINRTARNLDGSPVGECRKISEMTYEEAARYDYGSWFSIKFKGEQLPLLKDVLQLAKENGVLLKLDNKIWNFPEKFMDDFWELLRDYQSVIGITCKDLENASIAVSKLPDAQLHYDGPVNEERIKELCKLGKHLTVWLPLQSKVLHKPEMTFATDELCALVKQYAKLGIWIVSGYTDFDEIMDRFKPDIVETPGQIKPIKNPGYLVDLHTHSEHSHDSVCPIRVMEQAQRQKGMYGFAVTDHCDMHKWKETDVVSNISSSVEEVENLHAEKDNNHIHVFSGVEIGEGIWYPQESEKVLSLHDYDVIIGSVHTVSYKHYNQPYSCIDFSTWETDDIYEYMNQYLDDVLCVVRMLPCDVAAHLFCPLRYINDKYGFNIDCRIFEAKVRLILEAIIKRGIALEINTSQMSKGKKDCFEQDWVLSIYKELGGLLVTLGSDAHTAENAAREFEQAVLLLQKHGFRNCFYYEKRRSIQCMILKGEVKYERLFV